MRTIICLIVLLISPYLFSYPCPKSVEKVKEAQAAHDFLEKFKGQYQLGACQVEITTCSWDEESNQETPVAEVFLLDQYNRETYISLEFPIQESPLLNTKTQWNKRLLNYKKKDRHYEDHLGRTEHYQLEILTDWDDTTKINSLHLGSYSTNNQLNQTNGNDSIWSICEKGL